jgi:hypothetical protein
MGRWLFRREYRNPLLAKLLCMKRKRSRLSAVAKKAVKKVSNSRKRIEPALGRKTK